METAWEKETDPWSVIRRPARGWCAPSFHPTPTTWAQDLMAPGAGAAGVGRGVTTTAWAPGTRLLLQAPTLACMIAPLQRGSALPPASTINSHALSDQAGAREPKEAGRRQQGVVETVARGPSEALALGSCHSAPAGVCQVRMGVHDARVFHRSSEPEFWIALNPDFYMHCSSLYL